MPRKTNTQLPAVRKSRAKGEAVSRLGKGSGGAVNRKLYDQRDWGAEMVDQLSKGKSLTAAAKSIGLAVATMEKWNRDRPEFAAAIAEGQHRAKAWWEERGRQMTMDPTVTSANVTSYIFMMCNRFKQEYKRTDGMVINQDLRSGPQTNNQLNIGKMTDEELELLQQAGRLITCDNG